MRLSKLSHDVLIQIPVNERVFIVINYQYLADGYFAPLPGEEKNLPYDHLAVILADRLPGETHPSDGAPAEAVLFQEIPRFYQNEEGWLKSEDGFYFVDSHAIRGKIRGEKYLLAVNPHTQIYLWQNGKVEFLMRANHTLHSGIETAELADREFINMGPYYLMRTLLDGILSVPDIHHLLCESVR